MAVTIQNDAIALTRYWPASSSNSARRWMTINVEWSLMIYSSSQIFSMPLGLDKTANLRQQSFGTITVLTRRSTSFIRLAMTKRRMWYAMSIDSIPFVARSK
ncbi:a1.2 [Tranosema rostrale ichnovirus]|nr:a1.2 [Tranosema rostrale ichnovirus]